MNPGGEIGVLSLGVTVNELEWREPPDKPDVDTDIILEVWGRAGRTNGVGHGWYVGDDVWQFDGDDRVGLAEREYPTDRVCRWAYYPEPSWTEPL